MSDDNEHFPKDPRAQELQDALTAPPRVRDPQETGPMEGMTLNQLATVCHDKAHAAGWWQDYEDMPEQYRKYYLGTRYALIMSEASEAFEGLRKGKNDSHLPHRPAEEVELADLLIRVFDYAGRMGFDLSGAVAEKSAYNDVRADHQIKNRAAAGGKSL